MVGDIKILDWTGSRYPLGRHFHLDPRSLAYSHQVLPESALHSVEWTRRVPIFDQGQLGSCVGNAVAGIVGTDAAGYTGRTTVTLTADKYGILRAGSRQVDEKLAVDFYHLATWLDDVNGHCPPTDTGSTGLGGAKALQAAGLMRRYTHAFDTQALRSALQSGPVAAGTLWLNSMFEPDRNGLIPVDRSSGLAGGHEYDIIAWDAPHDRYRLANSWGASWGQGGYAYLAGTDMAWLLAQQGDIVVPRLAGT
ncbi:MULTISPECIES: C1 family peptidase [Frankia]|uniref:Peptidase C1A papain C-terminal domain-containing protein n=1 Tax=Frankia alni (strain DSM 45986 / CECT 9034 / ACN14a) TaxID=326424 RepID=Q0RME8_FRAAA|nr:MULTISPECIES: C1 family peptidase [Frankia]CAJ61303.1 hypothetical protein FRAAL2657 [Frankia alni ACN14a]